MHIASGVVYKIGSFLLLGSMCLTVLLQLIVATLGRPMQSTAAQRAIIKRGPDEEAAEALRKVAATLLQQACELLEQISRMSDSEGER